MGFPEPGTGEPVRLPVDGCLDLHAFAPRDIPQVVREYLQECQRLGILEVRVIHGKGTGWQREVVRRVLADLDPVASFGPAPESAGGWGATLVRLKPAAAAGRQSP
jgi:DNA-nicking Smr family endonuclease